MEITEKYIELKKFSFTNKSGGTGLSDWEFNEKFEKPAYAIIIEQWYDYECGQRGRAIPDPRNPELIEYLERNAQKSEPIDIINSQTGEIESSMSDLDNYVIYFSEFDITDSSN